MDCRARFSHCTPAGVLLRAFDAPAVLLPNGHVLCVVGAVVTGGPDAGWAGLPISFFEFDGTNLHFVPAPTNASNTLTYNCRLLVLPTGQVLYSNCTPDLEVFTSKGTPHDHWRPHITQVPKALRHGHSHRLRGRQLNGLSQANAYGDDAQMATNYPVVRLKYISLARRCTSLGRLTTRPWRWPRKRKLFTRISMCRTRFRSVTTNWSRSLMEFRRDPRRFTSSHKRALGANLYDHLITKPTDVEYVAP